MIHETFMKTYRKTPLAWKNLTHDWRRLSVALAGISFAVLLMFTQVGFQNALFDSQVQIIEDLQGDIFLVSKAKYTLAAEKRFPIARLHQARSYPGVLGAYPLYTELTTSVLKNLAQGGQGKDYPIRSIGFYLEDPIFRSQDIKQQRHKLRIPATALIDDSSRKSKFPFPVNRPIDLAGHPAELARKKITMVGSFHMGTDFAHDGNLIMSAQNFANYFPQHQRFGDPLGVVDMGIIHVDPARDVDSIRRGLQAILPNDIWVYTRQQFRDREVQFWDKSTPIGVIFNAGKIVGFIVGMVICYQVIYSDIADHMPEFATLKAMGYTHWFFIQLIITEALLLSLIGFLPGMIASRGLYAFLTHTTGLLMKMTVESILLVLVLTMTLCIASGLLAVRKLLKADPASLF
jgi:putative ABC transport system permease protein